MEQHIRDMRIHMRDYEDDEQEGMKTFMMKSWAKSMKSLK